MEHEELELLLIRIEAKKKMLEKTCNDLLFDKESTDPQYSYFKGKLDSVNEVLNIIYYLINEGDC